MNQGKMNIPTTAQTDQIFSHFQRFAYFTGVAKLPFRIPANNAKATARGTFDIEDSLVIQKLESRNQKLQTASEESAARSQNLEVCKNRGVGAALVAARRATIRQLADCPLQHLAKARFFRTFSVPGPRHLAAESLRAHEHLRRLMGTGIEQLDGPLRQPWRAINKFHEEFRETDPSPGSVS
jgi:hypothetical protein